MSPQVRVQNPYYYSQTSIYVLLHIRTFDLRTNFSERITLYTVRSHLDESRAISLSCDQRRTMSLSRGLCTSFYFVNARPGRPITVLHGTGRTLTKCDLTDTYSKFDIRTSLKINICTIQRTHNEYRSTHGVRWGLWGIGSSGLKLSITSNSLGMLGW